MKYAFRKGARIKGVKPEIAAAELEKIRDENDGLTPEVLLAAAQQPDSPMHAAFEWDDSEAAHQFRLQQARTLIRAVVIVHDEENSQPTSVYVHVPGDKPKYEPMQVVVSDVDLFQRALNALTEDLRGAQRACTELRRMRQEESRLSAAESHIDAAVSELAAV